MSHPISKEYRILTVKHRKKIRDYSFTQKRAAIRECKQFARSRGPGTRGEVTTRDGQLIMQGHVDERGRFIEEEL